MILEQTLEWKSSPHVAFIDYERALDSVDKMTLWKLLQHYGIPEQIIQMIRLAYELLEDIDFAGVEALLSQWHGHMTQKLEIIRERS